MTTIQIDIDSELKKAASEYFASQGQDLATAIREYLRKSIQGDCLKEIDAVLTKVSFGEDCDTYKYNKYGEACFDADDDDCEDEMYESMASPAEIAACRRRMMEARKNVGI